MKVKGFLYGLIASATFGLIPLFSIPALENGVGLDSLLFYRFSLASVLVAVLMWVKKIPFDIQKSEFGIAFILGTLYAITALWLTEAYLYIPSGVATTIHFLYPVVVSLIMFVFYKDKLTMPILLAMAMAVSGVYMLSGGNTPGGSINIKGLMLVLATVIAYAAYIVGMNRSRIARLDSLKATFYILLSGAIVFLVNLAIKGDFSRPDAESGHNDRRADGCFPPDVGIRPYTDTGHSLYRFDNDCDLGMHGAAYRRMHGRPFLRRASATDADRRNSSSAISSLHRDIRQLYQEMGAGYPTFIYAPDINDEIFT
jgi:drug/metabolite transporter (DMT)-like permease